MKQRRGCNAELYAVIPLHLAVNEVCEPSESRLEALLYSEHAIVPFRKEFVASFSPFFVLDNGAFREATLDRTDC
jgi:hypothetical protein